MRLHQRIDRDTHTARINIGVHALGYHDLDASHDAAIAVSPADGLVVIREAMTRHALSVEAWCERIVKSVTAVSYCCRSACCSVGAVAAGWVDVEGDDAHGLRLHTVEGRCWLGMSSVRPACSAIGWLRSGVEESMVVDVAEHFKGDFCNSRGESME